MLHGRVVRPPGINATLVSVDGFPKRIPDLVKVVVQKDFVGVVARSEIGAIQAAETLKVTWNDPGGAPKSHDELYAQMQTLPAQSRLLASDGNVDKALAGAAKVLEATYYYPYQLHGSMGPSCAIADVKARRGDGLVADAGRLPAPRRRREGARLQGPAGARDLQGRLRLLRPERRRHGLDRRGADVEGRRGSRPRAVDARGRARLGALRDADDPEGEGRPRRGRQPDRLGLREPPGLAGRPPRQRRRGEPADRRPDRAHAPGDAGERADVPAARRGQLEHGGRATCRTRRASSRTPA